MADLVPCVGSASVWRSYGVFWRLKPCAKRNIHSLFSSYDSLAKTIWENNVPLNPQTSFFGQYTRYQCLKSVEFWA